METPELIWDEARRLLDRQERDLDTLRTRALGVLSVGGLVAGLFAGHGIGQHTTMPRLALIALALAAFAASTVLAILIQRPKKWAFSHDLDQWIKELGEGEIARPIEVVYNIAEGLNNFRKENNPKIKRLVNMFTAMCVLLGVQVIAWGVTLAF